jgi:hypothetical protein
LTKNHDLTTEKTAKNKTIRNLIIAVIILSITTVGPWIVKLLRLIRVIPT